jgi:methylglyoxal synthase
VEQNKITIERDKKIALVAHDNKKRDLVDWAKYNRVILAHHTIYATGTTGTFLEQELGFPIHRLESGPLGGDQQIGARIVEGEIDFLIFFWDPLKSLSHDPDVKALLQMVLPLKSVTVRARSMAVSSKTVSASSTSIRTPFES